MFCKYCGAQIDNNAMFCSKCGKRIYGDDDNPVTGYENYMDNGKNVQEKRGMSIASMVLGIIGIFAWIIPIVGFPITIVGLILGILGRKKGGKVFATTGIILCIITLVLTIANSAIGAYQGYIGQNKFLNSITEEVSDVPSEYTKEYRIISDKELTKKEVQDVVAKLQKRADNFTTEAVVLMKQDENVWSIQITLPYMDDDVFESVISDTTLEFIARYGAEDAEVIVNNENIKSASAEYIENSVGTKDSVVNVEFDDEGAELFAAGTQKYIGEPISIVFDGEVITSPIVRVAITDGRTVISQNTYEDAELLASLLRVGSLGVKLEEK